LEALFFFFVFTFIISAVIVAYMNYENCTQGNIDWYTKEKEKQKVQKQKI